MKYKYWKYVGLCNKKNKYTGKKKGAGCKILHGCSKIKIQY